MDIKEFVKKYGYNTPTLLIAQFIQKAPEFPGDKELAKGLGEMVADLEEALMKVAFPNVLK